MKRLLSWLVLPVFMFVFFNLSYWLVSLVFFLARLGYNTSPVMFWIIVFLIGSVAVGLMLAVISLSTGVTVLLSEKIKPSENALRYKVAGIAGIAFTLLTIYFYVIGIVTSGSKAVFYITMAVNALFSLQIILYGKAKVKERKSNAVSEM